MRHTSFELAWQKLGLGALRQRKGRLVSATALGSALIAMAAAPGSALACFPGPSILGEVITCSSPTNLNLNALGGEDTINYESGTAELIDGGDDNDTINFTGGLITGTADARPPDEWLNIALRGGAGDDIITLSGTAVLGTTLLEASVTGGDGDDIITLDGATVHGSIRGEAGKNTLTVNSGTTDRVIGGDEVDKIDTITLNGGDIRLEINAQDGDDEIRLNGGTVRAVNGGSGNDTIRLNGSIAGGGSPAGFIIGGDGTDTIELLSGSVTGNVMGDAGSDNIKLDGTVTVNGNIFGGTETDTLRMFSGKVTGTVQSGNGIDTIIVGNPANTGAAGPIIGGAVDGWNGNDFIYMYSGSVSSVTGNGATGAQISGADNDEINLYGGTITSTGTAVAGMAGNDTINLGGPPLPLPPALPPDPPLPQLTLLISGTVDGGAGVDTFNFNTGSVLALAGGAGNDVFNLNGGTATSTGTSLDGGDDNDTINLAGTTLSGAALGGAGMDIFHIEAGSAAALDGGTEADRFYLSGGDVTGTVDGGDGNDRILLGYTETLSLAAGTTIGGDILGGAGGDLIRWGAGTFAGKIDGGAGSDIVSVEATSGYDGSQLLDGGDDTGTADGFIDGLTITGKTVSTTGGNLVNWETVTLAGGGLTLTDGSLAVGEAAGAGLFLTGGAYLHTGAVLNLIGNLDIASGSSLAQLAGNSHSISGRLANAGTVDLQDGGAGDVLAVSGNYNGGGQFLVDIDGDIADIMTVGGNVTGSPTQIVTTAIGNGTTGIPIAVVRVTGTTAAGDFTASDFDLGAYSYSLQLDGNTWQFVADEITDGGTLYPTVGGLLGLFARQTVATHFQRSGSWSRARATGEGASPDGVVSNVGADRGNVWLRGIGQWADGEGDLTAAAGGKKDHVSYDRDLGGLQGGLDFVMVETASYLVTGGVFGQGGRLSSDAHNETLDKSAGSAEADAWGFGGKLGLDTANSYAEVVGGWNFYDVTAETAPGAKSDTDGNGYFLSVEAGREFALSNAVSLVPQAQFAWLGTDIDSFVDSAGVKIAYDGDDMATGRLGLALDALVGTPGGQPLRLTGIVNYWYEFSDNPETSVGGTPMELDQANGSLEGGAGFHWGTHNDPLHLHGEVTYRDTVGGDGEQAWNATLGARVAF